MAGWEELPTGETVGGSLRGIFSWRDDYQELRPLLFSADLWRQPCGEFPKCHHKS